MTEKDCIAEAYLHMAQELDYRPRRLAGYVDNLSLEQEAYKYAEDFMKEEDHNRYFIGVSNFKTNKAFVYLIEAARMLCHGVADDLARELTGLAMLELSRHKSIQ